MIPRMRNINLLSMKLIARTNFILLCLFIFLASCSNVDEKNNSLIDILPDNSPLQNIDTAFINVINPYDCLNCMSSIKYVLNDLLSRKNNNIITYIIIPHLRKIELKRFEKEFLVDGANYQLIVDDKLFKKLKEQTNKIDGASFLLVLDVNTDKYKVYDYYDFRAKNQ